MPIKQEEDEEYDEEEDILLFGLPSPLFLPHGLRYPLFLRRNLQRRRRMNFFAGLKKNDDGFAIRRMNEKNMLADKEKKRKRKHASTTSSTTSTTSTNRVN
jgi:hypothetical protein